MSIERYIILRQRQAIDRDIFLGAAAVSPPPPSGLTVDVDDRGREALPAVTSSPEVVAVAPAIPMQLIAPVAAADVPHPVIEGMAWGVKAVRADRSPFSGAGVVVAVLDTGIDAAHPAFAGVTLVEKDFTGEGNGDENGHGTHCAGTIFGRNVEGTRIGVAPGVKRALIGKVLTREGRGSSDGIVKGIQWAVENGANVISISIGIDFPGLVKRLEQSGFPTELAVSRALEGYRSNVQLFERLAAFVRSQAAFGQTTVIVAAAGNESRRSVNADFEISVGPPAVSEGFVSVAALGQSAQSMVVADFSNTGANISGPGVGILSAKIGGGLQSLSGTSMATPHAAGVCALWAEKIRQVSLFNPLMLSTRLIGSATTTGLKEGTDLFDVGAGLVLAPQNE